jgi:cysteine desulfurase
MGVDAASLSGHKIGALSGVGALVFRRGSRIAPLLVGGPQELHRRAGTENLIGIVSFGIAAKLWLEEGESRRAHMSAAAQAMREEILRIDSRSRFLLPPERALPNTINVRFPGVRADDLVVALDLQGMCISSGAACASGKPEPSHVLLAMGFSELEARESVRISVRDDLDSASARQAARSIAATAASMRKEHA